MEHGDIGSYVEADATAPAHRVATAIGTVKWVLIGLYGLFIVLTLIGTFADTVDANGFLMVTIGSVIGAAVTWVVFGFAEHTLGMLVLIARHTSRR